jgi:transcription factor SPT20
VNGASTNGTTPRASNRQRRESHRPGDLHTRQHRNGSIELRSGRLDGGLGNARDSNRKVSPRPHGMGFRRPLAWFCRLLTFSHLVQTTGEILRKFRGHPPSLVLHLHPTHFRFDRQDGSFGYNSPMKIILEHIRAGTVPHDMLEELHTSNVKFYDGP